MECSSGLAPFKHKEVPDADGGPFSVRNVFQRTANRVLRKCADRYIVIGHGDNPSSPVPITNVGHFGPIIKDPTTVFACWMTMRSTARHAMIDKALRLYRRTPYRASTTLPLAHVRPFTAQRHT